MAWLSGWSYRKEISITGQSGAGTDYQVTFEIGDSAGGDFHLEGNCTSFPQDIEVTDDDGTTLLDFWIEDLTADPIKMWVEVADDLGSNQTIYVYYGKAESPTGSSIEDTFLFGDDFNAALDSNKWTTIQGAIATSGGDLQLISTTGTRGLIEQNTTNYPAISQGAIIEGSGYGTAKITSSHFCTMRKAGDWTYRVDHGGASTTGTIRTHTQNASGTTFTNISTTITSTHRYRINWYTGTAKYYIDDVLKSTHTSYVPTVDLAVAMLEGSEDGEYMYMDWVFVRKYNDPEPAFSSAGSEETPAADTSTDLLHGKIIIKDSSIILVDGLIQVKDSITDLFDGEIKVIEKVTSLADGKLQVQDVATSLADGKLQVKDIVTGVADGKVQIQDTDTDLADGKLQVQDVDTDLADGIIQVKDSITSLADGKVQIQDTDIDLADGKIKVQDSATGLADGLLRVQDKATGLTDGKVQIQDTDTDLADGLIKVQDSVSDLADGKVIVTTAGIDTGYADGKIQIKDVATGIVDGIIKVKDSVTGLVDGKVQVKDSVTNLTDGKVIVSTVSTATGQVDGKIQIKDVATGIVDGLLKIVVAIRRISIGNLKPSFRLITKNQKPSYRLVAEQPKPTYRLKTENK